METNEATMTAVSMARSVLLFVMPILAVTLLSADDAQPLSPTHANVSYGPHSRNVLDYYQAEGDGPRPLLVDIHGGGWTGGNKRQDSANFRSFLEQGISYAAIDYRLISQAPLPAPVHDVARAIQFIRSKAGEWNINSKRIALTGRSPGACTSMWILLHDDLADPDSKDAVLHQSTRVTAAAVAIGQTSIDPKVIEPWLGPNVLKHRIIYLSVDQPTIGDVLKNYEKHRRLYHEFSPYNHLDEKDPPLFMSYDNNMKLPSESVGHGIHHPVYGVKMKEKSDQQGHECHLLIDGVSKSDVYSSPTEFLLAKLLARSIGGAVAESTVAEGTVAEGTVAEGTVAEGTVAEGTVAESTVAESTVAEGTETDVVAPRDTYLLLDSRLIDKTEGVRLRVGRPTKHAANPLFGEEHAWEVRFDNLYPNVLYDEQRKLFRCWYDTFVVDLMSSETPRKKRLATKYQGRGRRSGLCYAESRDGLTWTKPMMNHVQWQGKPSNIIGLDWHGAGVFIDPHSKDAQQRYKMFLRINKPSRKVAVASSADGLRWGTPLARPQISARADTHNNALWAPTLDRYVGITRLWDGQRIVARTESKDFINWTKAVEVLRGTVEQQTYAMPTFYYQGIYLGLVAVYRPQQDRTHTELAWSPDTITWHRVDPGTPLLANSTKEGAYDWGCAYPGLAPIVRGDTTRIYYGGSNGRHGGFRDGSLCLATLKQDRFAGWTVDRENGTGTIVTQPFKLETARLELNVAAPKGQIAVEVLDRDGNPLDGYSGADAKTYRNVDALRLEPSWKRPLENLKGKSVRLKFILQNVTVYAFQSK